MQFLVIAYDGTDEGALDRRMAVREKHIEGARQMKESGTMLKGVRRFKGGGASNIILVLPYLPYARHEKELTSVTHFFGTLLKQAGVDLLITSDVHSAEVESVMSLNLHNISLASLWSEHLTEKFIKEAPGQDWCLVSPDKGGRERVEQIAALLNLPMAVVKKERRGADQAKALELEGDVARKSVILIDDILDTGRTAISACDLLLERGAVRVIGCFSHPVFSPGAIERLSKSRMEKIVVTDTILFDVASGGEKFVKIFSAIFLADKIQKVLDAAV